MQRVTRSWHQCHIGHRSHYSIERLLAFRDYHERTSNCRATAVCLLSSLPELAVTLAIDCIPLRTPSTDWRENNHMWVRWFLALFGIALRLAAHLKQTIPGNLISTCRALSIALATAISCVVLPILLAATWRFPIPFGYVLLVAPFVSLFWFFTGLTIGRRTLSKSSVLRQNIKTHLLINCTQGFVAVACPVFSAVFTHLSGTKQAAFVFVMPIIKFTTKQVIATAAADLHEYIGPIVVLSVDLFNGY
ncbi:hypothetical protein PHYSODRAFT_500638 [Phytophthora sojae]|uniref:Uncharacterized protein n=1 Tax=Phytophthora sojae (strain P6497) TaxID=1094619 RepID=G4ZG94_PHYSP|nr:hypothetical protein PHYSODRAFT_500638 [Phytophthora sojae]EGZ17997.1 hypothetical protein PHYSODRAFT_500638 [Phytophthora sojae]|eukprot:XP_009527055.1 hypothetical protein PHYSODRAFT_500638 [Phytophthora sojae]